MLMSTILLPLLTLLPPYTPDGYMVPILEAAGEVKISGRDVTIQKLRMLMFFKKFDARGGAQFPDPS